MNEDKSITKEIWDFYYSQKVASEQYKRCPIVNGISYTEATRHGEKPTALVDDAEFVYSREFNQCAIIIGEYKHDIELIPLT